MIGGLLVDKLSVGEAAGGTAHDLYHVLAVFAL